MILELREYVIGTGVTVTADRANVSQWLAWVLMILTGAMNRPGGTWFHPLHPRDPVTTGVGPAKHEARAPGLWTKR